MMSRDHAYCRIGSASYHAGIAKGFYPHTRGKKMRALHITPPVATSDLRLIDVPMPEPGRGRCVSGCTLRHSTTATYTSSREPDTGGPCLHPRLRWRGPVDAVGPDVRERAVGDAVLIFPTLNWGERDAAPGPGFDILGGPTDGTLAEYLVLPAENVLPETRASLVGGSGSSAALRPHRIPRPDDPRPVASGGNRTHSWHRRRDRSCRPANRRCGRRAGDRHEQ